MTTCVFQYIVCIFFKNQLLYKLASVLLGGQLIKLEWCFHLQRKSTNLLSPSHPRLCPH